MAGFLTHYLIGMEARETMSDIYIRQVMRGQNHAFLIGLQGFHLFSFDPHSLSKRGLSYRTATVTQQNQEFASLFDNMIDYTLKQQGQEREVCIAYAAGFLCYFAADQAMTPYIHFRTWQDLPVKCSPRRAASHRKEVETVIDTVLLRSHCHMEPSQLNFEALTFASKKDLTTIGRMMRYAFLSTFKSKVSPSEITNGLKNARRQNIHLNSDAHFRRLWLHALEKYVPISGSRRKIYEDFLPDDHDFMNTACAVWYPYPGSPDPQRSSVEEIYNMSLHSCRDFLDDLDTCFSWGMDREDLIKSIIRYEPFSL